VHREVDSRPKCAYSWKQIQTLKYIFSTSIALICRCMWTQLLQPLAQSLIWSPGTLLADMQPALQPHSLVQYNMVLTTMWRGGRQTKDFSQTRSFGFQFQLGKHFGDERGLAFYYLKIEFLEYLKICGGIWCPNAPIGY